MALWQLHGDGRTIASGAVVAPEERLAWAPTVGVGLQHVIAMFGATFLVPVLIGFPPSTTIFFSGIATLIFLVVVRNRVPSYLGSSFAFIAPVLAVKAGGGGMSAALGGILCTGAAFFLIGAIVHTAGARVVNAVMPPVVTGTIVALIGLNLAGSAKDNFFKQPIIGVVTLGSILLVGVLVRGLIGRLYILGGVIIGWIVAGILGKAPLPGVSDAGWIGLPAFHLPTFDPHAIALIVPAVVAITAENTGHVKAVATMTGRNLDDMLGRAYMGDGIGTMIAGGFGGSATTTYAENIGVMAATRVYSTAAYMVAGIAAIILGVIPKFGAFIATIPAGVLGGATTVLYGMIGILGARIWVEERVDFRDPVNLTTAAVGLILGIANFTVSWGGLSFAGIAVGSFATIVIYHVLRSLSRVTGAGAQEPEAEGKHRAVAD